MATSIDKVLSKAIKGKKLLAEDQLSGVFTEAEKTNQPLASVLVKKGLLSEDVVLDIFAKEFKLNRVNLRTFSIDKSLIDQVPLKVASYYKFMPLKIEGEALTIVSACPFDVKTQDEIRVQLGYPIEVVLAPENEISEVLNMHYGLAADTIQKIMAKTPGAQPATSAAPVEKIENIEKFSEEESVTKLVNQIIFEAYKKRATDIHIEPSREGVRLRYRIDGTLHSAPVPPEIKNFYSSILSRFKIMSNLNIVERRLPQDGRAVVQTQDQVVDLRISCIPTPHDESLVIRILPTKMLFSLEKLGLSSSDLGIFKNLINKPYGIIFVTGPTGSGKTTTLYTCLSTLNTDECKIVTIEDPIEYELQGIIQMQVMSEIGLDFARGLRSMLRHDPDVIMVGEVRDLETAEIAIRTALTGHLVFSTLHTNDAASAVIRLMDIGIGTYLIASSVQAFIAQRLIRVICQECKCEDDSQPQQIRARIARELGLDIKSPFKFNKGKGCRACNGTGFFGRTAIYEILLVDDVIKELIFKKASSEEIKKMAIKRGMHTLRQDGWRKVIEGLTTPEEIVDLTQVHEDMELEGILDKKENSLFGTGGGNQETGMLEIKKVWSDENSKAEKREYERIKTKINVRYRLLKSGQKMIKIKDQQDQLVTTEDMSAGGILLISDDFLETGSIIDLKIELPDTGQPIECLAKVIRDEQIQDKSRELYKIAVCFLDLSGAERTRLLKYIIEESI